MEWEMQLAVNIPSDEDDMFLFEREEKLFFSLSSSTSASLFLSCIRTDTI